MIDILFQQESHFILVRISGNSVLFGNTAQGMLMSDISGLKLYYSGVIKEFPDLEKSENWKEEAIKRFKAKIKSLPTEGKIGDYIIEDLRKHGFEPKKIQIKGRRPRKIE